MKFKTKAPFRFLVVSMLTLQLTLLSCITGFQGTVFAAEEVATGQETTVSDTNPQAGLLGVLAVGLLALKGHDGHDKTPPATQDSSQTNTSSKDNNTKPAPTPNPNPKPNPPVKSSGLTADEQKAFTLLNQDRAANGLPPLKLNQKLVGLAENYAQDMINRNYFSHYNPEGQSPFDRMRNAGISFSYAGENIAINSSVDSAEKAFMNSPGHRANILSKDYQEVGIGVKLSPKGSVYVVQEFLSR